MLFLFSQLVYWPGIRNLNMAEKCDLQYNRSYLKVSIFIWKLILDWQSLDLWEKNIIFPNELFRLVVNAIISTSILFLRITYAIYKGELS